MGSKTMIKWPKQITTSLVEQLIRAEKDLQKATLVFDAATAEYTNGYRHDHSTFGLMISRLLSTNQFSSAEDLLNRMKDEKCKITEDIFLSICRAYGRVHKPLDAIKIFQKMKEYECEPSPKSYVTVFDILVNENHLKMALRFYRYMREKGIPTSVASLNVLIKALCKNSGTIDAAVRIFREMPNRGCTPDSYTYGTLINGLCRSGKISDAKEIFTEMDAKGCSPTVVTYTSLIHGLCQSNNLDEAMGSFKEMKIKDIEPNFSNGWSLQGWTQSQAMELLEIMVQKRHVPNMITYSTLIHGLCKEGKLREAVEILDRMKLQGLKADAGLFGKIISGLCDVYKFQEAANFLDEMVLGGISPNRVTWSLHVKIHNAVVQGLCTDSDSTRAFQLYLSMRTRGISVEPKTFSSLISRVCKKGDLHKATRIIDEMVLDGCVPDEGTWSMLVSGFWGRRKVREAADLVKDELMDEPIEAPI
ncbi:unnamed protein product [Ilex paraguariensis]|uniref:Pentatricopeptide repeat-containing protein n=1 Tax=Ilex paraguariensis TaxID=185542 RepID=A0ABC8ULB7_9AQUA